MTIRELIPWAVGSVQMPDRSGEASAFSDLHRRMNRLFDDVWTGAGLAPIRESQAVFMPRIAVEENDNAYVVHAELPGMNEADVDVTLEEGVLTISGEKKQESTQEEKNVRYSEMTYGAFRRVLPVGDHVKADDVKAEFSNGVLTVTLPKMENPSQSRKIPINTN